MKNQILLFIFLLICVLGNSQSIIFPIKGEPIKNCEILKVESPNLIMYVMAPDTLITEAKAYILDGKYNIIDFRTNIQAVEKTNIQGFDSLADLHYNGHSYLYYQQEFLKAKSKKKTGIIISSIGAGLAGIGGGILINANNNKKQQEGDKDALATHLPATLLLVSGGAILISGLASISISNKKIKQNQNCMEQCKPKDISINFGIQENGIGLKLRF